MEYFATQEFHYQTMFINMICWTDMHRDTINIAINALCVFLSRLP